MSSVAPRPAAPTTALRAVVGGAVRRAEVHGPVRRLLVLLGMVVLLGGFVGMHQMSGSPVAHGPAHGVTDPVAPVAGHATGDASAQGGAPSGTGHGEMEAMCLLVLVALLTLVAPGLRRLPDGATHAVRVVAPGWRLGSVLRAPSLVALGISRR